MDFRTTSVVDLAEQVRSKKVSSRELTQAVLDNIERIDVKINSFCAINAEQALTDADEIDGLMAKGENLPLAGVPIGVKDLEDAKGFITTFGSSLHVQDPVAETDSELVRRLKQAGCVVIGKTNTPEFGHKGKTDNVPFGVTRNPWNMDYTPGGSSGGTAAALAAGIIPLGTGSDGGGSIRIPSSLCGLSGIKCSQGRIPNGGQHPPGSGILTVKGPMTKNMLDAAYVLDETVGDLKTDIFGLPDKRESWFEQVQSASLPEKVIWSPTMGFATVDTEIRTLCEEAVAKLETAGIPDAQRAVKMSDELIDNVFDTNLVGPWILSCEVARRLIDQKLPGRMVNVSSMAAFNITAQSAAALYSTTKLGIVRMTEAFAAEWARFNINVNCIAPGAFSSEMMDGMLARIGDISQMFPRKRICDPAQMDSTLLFLVSPSSECVTGTVIKVDDGQGPR